MPDRLSKPTRFLAAGLSLLRSSLVFGSSLLNSSILLMGSSLLTGSYAVAAADTSNPAAGVNDPKKVVMQLYAAFDRGDMPAVLGLIGADATWTYYGPDYSLPFAGVFHGPAGVARFFEIVDETLTDVTAGQREYLVAGDQVTVPGWEESTVRATGAHYRVDNVHLYTVHDNKIVKFEEFINSSDVLEAFMPADADRGKALFTTCAGCHGDSAQGRPEIHAPNLTVLGAPYLTRQLRNFRNGARGSESDTYGYMMIGRASALPGDRGLRDVAAYIDTLPRSSPRSAARGDARRGQILFEPCAACHGARAQGDEALDAPPLRQQDENYLAIQLRHFADGTRGTQSADKLAGQMRAPAVALGGDAGIADVIAYIESLE
jgi:cytochrome c553